MRAARLAAALLALALALALAVAEQTARPAQAQEVGAMYLAVGGDVSPPTNETSGNDHSTAELIHQLVPVPNLICVPGDVQYEYGAEAMFRAVDGFEGSWGRLFGSRITCPAVGNHDAADPGPGSPGWYAYFRPNLDGSDATGAPALGCLTEPNPCRPDLGYYVLDLPVAPGSAELGWAIYVLDSNCQRAGGGTGDIQTESCAGNGRMATWLRDAFNRRHGGLTSGRKCSAMVWHHERWGTGFFADDPAVAALWNIGNHYHNDLVFSGHTHSLARMGPMTTTGTVHGGGAGQRQITAGASGRSLTPNRVEPPRVGTRYRNNTKYGVAHLKLASTRSPAGWLGGSWGNTFRFVDGTSADPATSGCWA
jgi:Calcineurin-like phosphoesterase